MMDIRRFFLLFGLFLVFFGGNGLGAHNELFAGENDAPASRRPPRRRLGGRDVPSPVKAEEVVAEDRQSSNAIEKVTCTGKVVGENGEPIGGAMVTLYSLTVSNLTSVSASVASETMSKEDGSFVFLGEGSSNRIAYVSTILAEKAGLSLGWASWKRSGDGDVKIVLSEPVTLGGRVVDANGNGIADAEVSVGFLLVGAVQDGQFLIGDVSKELFSTQSDEEGAFSFGRLPLGTSAEFVIKKAGYATVSTFNPMAMSAGVLQYKAGGDDAKIEMVAASRVEGKVVEGGTGTPITDVGLRITGQMIMPIFGLEMVKSTEDGSFCFDDMGAGTYTISVGGHQTKVAEWVGESVTVTLETPGTTVSGVIIEVSKGGMLEAVVTRGSDGRPVEGAVAIVTRGDQMQATTGESGEDGVVRMRLAPGSHTIQFVQKEGYAQIREQEEVVIKGGETVRIERQLVDSPKVRGTVRDESGNVVAGVRVCAMPTYGMPGGNVTNEAGGFEFDWDPRVWGHSDEDQEFYLLARDVGRNLAGTVKIDEDRPEADIVVTEGVTITGQVVGADGKGISGANVVTMLNASNWGAPISRGGSGRPEADELGYFSVQAVPKGHKYTVAATADGYGKKQAQVLADDAVDNRIDAGVFELAVADQVISGVVVDIDGNPMEGVQIHTYGEGQPDRHGPGLMTDAEGKFKIEGVCAGPIRVNANKRGETYMHASVETEGGATDVKLILSDQSGRMGFVPKAAVSLVGKPLREAGGLGEFGIELAGDPNGMLVVCFCDMNQRPSRHVVRELVGQVDELAGMGVTIVAVQAEGMERGKLDEWVGKLKVPFVVGMIDKDAEKVREKWGVQRLPWLVVVDGDGVVAGEGVGVGELVMKCNELGSKSGK